MINALENSFAVPKKLGIHLPHHSLFHLPKRKSISMQMFMTAYCTYYTAHLCYNGPLTVKWVNKWHSIHTTSEKQKAEKQTQGQTCLYTGLGKCILVYSDIKHSVVYLEPGAQGKRLEGNMRNLRSDGKFCVLIVVSHTVVKTLWIVCFYYLP